MQILHCVTITNVVSSGKSQIFLIEKDMYVGTAGIFFAQRLAASVRGSIVYNYNLIRFA